MAALNVFNVFSTDIAAGTHAGMLNADTDVIKVFLTNTLPVAATHTTYGAGGGAELDDLATGNGYTKGGEDAQNSATQTGTTITLVTLDITWTASGAVPAFQYAVLYNDTAASDNLIGWIDNGSAINMTSGDTFKADFGVSTLTVG